jgi:2-phosphosulfolactate phosphatase
MCDLGFEWGLGGLRALAPHSDAVVIVDVLSFSTAVDIAVSRDTVVLPYRWKDESASRFAREKGALLAGDRESQYSLSPASLRSIERGTRLLLPSPNGSTLSLHGMGVPTLTACLRNAPAVATRAARYGRRIAVIAAGERWQDDSLRPCIEDLIGAGAVLTSLPGSLSPEAELAAAAFVRFEGKLHEVISRSASGLELIERGFARDVELACEYGVSSAAPVLDGDGFVDSALR